MNHGDPIIDPALWCDAGRWQVVRDEVCLFLPRRRRLGYLKCRLWCWRHGYGWLPIQ